MCPHFRIQNQHLKICRVLVNNNNDEWKNKFNKNNSMIESKEESGGVEEVD